MPIKGLSDQVRLARLDKIRLGIKVAGGKNSYPRPVDHFVCPEPVKKVYGEQPRELRILFPNEDDSKWASQFYRCYSQAKGLICKGDGERATALIDEQTGSLATRNSRKTSFREIDCNPGACARYGKRCRRVMNLQFLLPDVPGLGVWQVDTSSYWSITNINNGIQLIRQACGRVSMIPLLLKLVPQEAQPNGLKKTIYVLTLDTPLTLIEMLRYAQLPPSKVLLPAPDTEPPDDLFPAEAVEKAGATRGDPPSDITPEIRNLGDLFQACYRHYGMTQSQVLEVLGLSKKQQITDPQQVWRTIVEALGDTPRPPGKEGA